MGNLRETPANNGPSFDKDFLRHAALRKLTALWELRRSLAPVD